MATTTLVATGGKGSNPKTSLYVGGLAENVNEEILQAAFLPFGDLKDVNIPLDHATGKHRGEVGELLSAGQDRYTRVHSTEPLLCCAVLCSGPCTERQGRLARQKCTRLGAWQATTALLPPEAVLQRVQHCCTPAWQRQHACTLAVHMTECVCGCRTIAQAPTTC